MRRWLTAARLRLAARQMAAGQRAMRTQERAAGTVSSAEVAGVSGRTSRDKASGRASGARCGARCGARDSPQADVRSSLQEEDAHVSHTEGCRPDGGGRAAAPECTCRVQAATCSGGASPLFSGWSTAAALVASSSCTQSDTHPPGAQGVRLTEVPGEVVADEAKSGVAEAYAAAAEGGGMHRRWEAACSSWESDMASCALARRQAAKSRAATQQMSNRPVNRPANRPAGAASLPAGRHLAPSSSHASAAAIASPCSCSKLPSWNRTWTPHHPVTAQAAVHASMHASSLRTSVGSEQLPPPTSSAAEGASSPSRTIPRSESVPASLLLLRAAEEDHVRNGAYAESRVVGREIRMEAKLARLEGALLTQSQHARAHPLNSVRGGTVRQRVRAT